MAENPRFLTHLTRCPRCGYDIAALPRRHRCPECGYEYDESMFVLEGWRLPGSRPPRPETLVIAGAILLGMIVLWADAGWSWIILVAIWTAVVAGAMILRWYGRWRYGMHSRALVHYLITSDGVSRVGGSDRRIYLWRNYSHLMLMPDGRHGWRLHLYPSWWRLFGPPLVNATLECDEAEAEVVRAEIQRRINAARSEGG